tara:strand:+ start:358 stop:579 length:222 start_codon:yes stop_codon:yes gene_type:complete
MGQVITAFYGVFEEKLKKMKNEIRLELNRAKSIRRKDWLKKQLKEAKSMRDHLKTMKKNMRTEVCPHCGESID